jgi:hypothetical protein
MIKVKWLKAHFKFAYSKGNVGFVSAGDIVKYNLLEGGFVMLIPEAEKYSEQINPLPADLPGRDKLFIAGFDSIEKIKQAAGGDSLLDVVSNAVLKKLVKYLKD